MVNGYIAKKGNVEIFLREMKNILNNPDCEIIIDPRDNDEYIYSTKYCLTELGYQEKDVIKVLLKLEITDYVESCKDTRNPKSNEFYIFGVNIEKKEIYIKVKISSYTNKIILCMSFHFAEFPLTKAKWKNGKG